jgi:FixJ family two-component response regulator
MSGYNPEVLGGAPDIEKGLDYLQKPFTEAALLDAVRRQLDHRG